MRAPGWKQNRAAGERTGAQDLTELLYDCISPERACGGSDKDQVPFVTETPRQSPRAQGRRDQEVRTEDGAVGRGRQGAVGELKRCGWGFLSSRGRRACVLSHSFNRFLLNQ